MTQDRQAVLDAATRLSNSIDSADKPVDHFTFVSIVARMAQHDPLFKQQLLEGLHQEMLPSLFEHIKADVENQERMNRLRKKARLSKTDQYFIKRQVVAYGSQLGWSGLGMNEVLPKLTVVNIPPRDQQLYWEVYENDYCVTFHGKIVVYKPAVLAYLKEQIKFILEEKQEKVDERELLKSWQETFDSAKSMYRKKKGFTSSMKDQMRDEMKTLLDNIPTVDD